MIRKVLKRSAWTLLTIFFAILFAILMVAGQIADDYSAWVDQYFGVTSRYKLVNKGEDADEDSQYFKSDFAVKDEGGNLVLTETEGGVKKQTFDDDAMRAHSMETSLEANIEGSVLLWNEGGALPLAKGSKVSVFGSAVYDTGWVYTGLGSGKVGLRENPNIIKSLTSRSFEVNTSLNDAYTTLQKLGFGNNREKVNEPDWSKISQRIKNVALDDSVAMYNDAAIVILNRVNGEEADAMTAYALTDAEVDVLTNLVRLKKANRLKKIILVIDSANAISMKQLIGVGIDACLWVGYGGSTATDAVADMLVGNGNPSGHFTDTWVNDIYSAPAMENFGNFVMEGASDIISQSGYDTYVVYQEGIYVGYRYYETRYEDYVLGRGGADSAAGVKAGSGNWKYADEVAYPFGYGGSYTTFEYSDFSVKPDGRNYTVSVTVTNTGSVAGKDAVEVYLQKPYTEYDKANKIEKAAVELVGFAKTRMLYPASQTDKDHPMSETVTVTVSEYDFKSYDAYGKGTYILEQGDYYLAVGTDAHDALNNILAAKAKTANSGVQTDRMTDIFGNPAAGNSAFAYRAHYATDDFETYSVSPFTGEKITNHFNDADINLYEGTADQKITYLSRSDWEGTYPSAVQLKLTNDVLRKALELNPEVVEDPDAKMPVYSTVTSEYGKLSLIQLKGVPYDDPMWEDLLNQMSFEEQVVCVMSRVCGAESVSAPGGGAIDGPGGMSGSQKNSMAFPCETVLASTFNLPLVEEIGRCFGHELMHRNFVGLFGPGANTHRTAESGRTWEYWSEDGFLGGKMNASESKGLTDMGAMLFNKHFLLNDQETNRMTGVMTWANEQSIREIYLRSFEEGMANGSVNGVMTSFNRIGATWSGNHKGLLTDVSRGEWGFEGDFLTDAGGSNIVQGSPDHNSIYAAGLIAGETMWYSNMTPNSLDEYKSNATVMLALREAVHRQLYIEANSSAMNGVTSSTQSVYVLPAWEVTVNALQISSGVAMGLCFLVTVLAWVIWAKHREEE